MNAAVGDSKRPSRVDHACATVASIALALWLVPLDVGAMEPALPNLAEGARDMGPLATIVLILATAGLLGGAVKFFCERPEPGASCGERAAKLARDSLQGVAFAGVVPFLLLVAQDLRLEEYRDPFTVMKLFGLGVLVSAYSKNLRLTRRCPPPEPTGVRGRVRA